MHDATPSNGLATADYADNVKFIFLDVENLSDSAVYHSWFLSKRD